MVWWDDNATVRPRFKQILNYWKRRSETHYSLVRDSFIKHEVFYSSFTLIWRHSSLQLTNSLVAWYDRVINQWFKIQINSRQLLRLMVSLWLLMHSVTIPTLFSEKLDKIMHLSQSLFPHANTESPEVRECNRILW